MGLVLASSATFAASVSDEIYRVLDVQPVFVPEEANFGETNSTLAFTHPVDHGRLGEFAVFMHKKLKRVRVQSFAHYLENLDINSLIELFSELADAMPLDTRGQSSMVRLLAGFSGKYLADATVMPGQEFYLMVAIYPSNEAHMWRSGVSVTINPEDSLGQSETVIPVTGLELVPDLATCNSRVEGSDCVGLAFTITPMALDTPGLYEFIGPSGPGGKAEKARLVVEELKEGSIFYELPKDVQIIKEDAEQEGYDHTKAGRIY